MGEEFAALTLELALGFRYERRVVKSGIQAPIKHSLHESKRRDAKRSSPSTSAPLCNLPSYAYGLLTVPAPLRSASHKVITTMESSQIAPKLQAIRSGPGFPSVAGYSNTATTPTSRLSQGLGLQPRYSYEVPLLASPPSSGPLSKSAPSQRLKGGLTQRKFERKNATCVSPLNPGQKTVSNWPSRDPIGERGGFNLYGFVYNSPLGWIDYLGRERVRSEAGFGFTSNYADEDGTYTSEKAKSKKKAGGEEDNGFRARAAQGIKGVIGEGRTGKDLFDFLEKVTNDKCCISRLNIASHGGVDGVGGTKEGYSGLVADKDKLWSGRDSAHEEGRDLKDLEKKIKSGKIKFCKPCEIRIYGCKHELLPPALAALTKCTVVASIGQQCGMATDGIRWNGNFHQFNPDGTKDETGEDVIPSVKNDGHVDSSNRYANFDPRKR
jgi:hypothetical protein